jgi:hypothetical protein
MWSGQESVSGTIYMFVRATTIRLDYYYKSRKSKALSEKKKKKKSQKGMSICGPRLHRALQVV